MAPCTPRSLRGSAGVFRRAPDRHVGPGDNTALWLATIASTNQISTVATAPSNSGSPVRWQRVHQSHAFRGFGHALDAMRIGFQQSDALPSDIVVDPDNAMVAFTATPADGLFKTTDGGPTGR